MNSSPLAHAFTSVDTQQRPAQMVEVLDRLNNEPFYDSYKRHLRSLLGAERGSRLLDVGAGAGDTARSLTADYDAAVVALDQSVTMASAMRDRGVQWVLAADGHRLPLRSEVFDGVLADRVLQHVASPERVLDEMLRVLRPGGRIALADPDYGTQALDIGDEELGHQVLRFRADFGLRNGTLAHQHAGLLALRGLQQITADARTLVVRDPSAVDNVMGLRSWAHTAAKHGRMDSAAAVRFVELFDEAVRAGRFTYSVTFFLTAGRLPAS